MIRRFDESRATVDDFGDEFLVECPRCRRCAHVRDRGAEATGGRIALACAACGHSAVWRSDGSGARITSVSTAWFAPGRVGVGATVDWYFHLPLWLQAPCCGETLWAYNARHLDFLERFVAAALRERAPDARHGWSNRGLASRLPRWMQQAGHRAAVLDGIARLRAGRLREEAG